MKIEIFGNFSLKYHRLTKNFDTGNSLMEVATSFGTSTFESGSVRDLRGLSMMVGKDCVPNVKYVKNRRYQLVAATGTGATSLPCGINVQGSSADGYYKKRKYQLVRTALVDKSVPAANDPPHEDGEPLKFSGKGRSKPLSSSVWKLHDTESKSPDTNLDRSRRIKHFFPWKRTTYLRDIMSTPSGSSPSIWSQKLLSRGRATGYIRSAYGFSLRRSKLSSIAGSNLKWLKSFENKSIQEATLAVVADKNKKERRMAVSDVPRRRSHVYRKSVYNIKLQPGERILCIGSQQYKMDPTRKTLHRITNDEDKLQSETQTDRKGRKSYMPRRLFFGNNEYVRIGNGNQLVRNPKKRTRTWASEKVRQSLHTARARFTKQKRYCQFFTRFGHCHKNDGKCRYIHDPSKIVVCTKFLNGSCSNPNCKLTHKVIPERMPDCSYFLQGLCSSKSCPYRHVNVHPSASACEGFLKGYCANGDECRQKHTYVCPIFQATGECSEGSKCKLHHPRKRSEKKKPLRQRKKARLRYFVSSHTDTSDCTVTNMISEGRSDDIFCEDEKTADYMSLDGSYGEEERTVSYSNEQASDPCPSEAPVSTVDGCIKPILLMRKCADFSH